MPAPHDAHLQRRARGRSLRLLRQRRRLTTADVARRLRLPEMDVQDYEAGRHVADESAHRLSCYHLSLLNEGGHHGL